MNANEWPKDDIGPTYAAFPDLFSVFALAFF